MEKMPDEEITAAPAFSTLHSLLKEHISAEEKMVQSFESEEEGYLYEFRYAGFMDGIKMPFHREHLTYRELKKEIKSIPRHLEICEGIEEFIIEKINIETKDSTLLVLTKNGEPMSIENLDFYYEPYTVLHFENGFRAIFPHPFQKGDLVCGIDNKTPFVFIEAKENTVAGYHLTNTGLKEQEIYTFPLELEYCRKGLKGKEKALAAVSDFVKGKTDLATFANLYHKAELEGYAEKIRISLRENL
ncbi:MAG: hypothetical protein IKJ74_02615 [Clostridia bacterium]|nr:hypothetical protein [Clostridia bacterium]